VTKFQKPSPTAIERVQREANRRLTPEEFAAYVDAPMSAEERDDQLALIRWFRARYPTPAARLAHARRLGRSWFDASSPLGAPAALRCDDDPIVDLDESPRAPASQR